MKKIILLLAALFALWACSKSESEPEREVGLDDIVFDFSVKHPATKGTPKGWVKGDAVYVFFQDISTGYLVLTYNGEKWNSSFKGTARATDLASSGKQLGAVYMPYGIKLNPVFNDGKWEIGDQSCYFMVAENVPYTYTSNPSTDEHRISASISMTVPSWFVQFFIPDEEATGTIQIACNGIQRCYITKILTEDNALNIYWNNNYTQVFTAYAATVDGEKGYYLSGRLNGYATVTDYLFIAEKSGHTYTFFKHLDNELAGGNAVRLPSFSSTKWIETGADKHVWIHNIKWGTVNVGATSPLDAGTKFEWKWTEEDWASAGVPAGWSVPGQEMVENLLINGTNKYHINIHIGDDSKYCLVLVDSEVPDHFLILPYTQTSYGYLGEYWTSTIHDGSNQTAYYLVLEYITDVHSSIAHCSILHTLPVRAVKF